MMRTQRRAKNKRKKEIGGSAVRIRLFCLTIHYTIINRWWFDNQHAKRKQNDSPDCKYYLEIVYNILKAMLLSVMSYSLQLLTKFISIHKLHIDCNQNTVNGWLQWTNVKHMMDRWFWQNCDSIDEATKNNTKNHRMHRSYNVQIIYSLMLMLWYSDFFSVLLFSVSHSNRTTTLQCNVIHRRIGYDYNQLCYRLRAVV